MILNLAAKKRELGTKSTLTKMRADGNIPAVVYGEGQVGKNLVIEERDFIKLVRKSIGELAIINIDVDGEIIKTVIKDKQIHPVTRKYLHVDFLELHPGTELHLKLPIHFEGDPEGTKEGGKLDVHVRELDITCLPKDIPEDVKIDISGLKLGEGIHVSDIEIPNVTIKNTPETTLVNVAIPRGTDADSEEEEGTEEAAE